MFLPVGWMCTFSPHAEILVTHNVHIHLIKIGSYISSRSIGHAGGKSEPATHGSSPHPVALHDIGTSFHRTEWRITTTK